MKSANSDRHERGTTPSFEVADAVFLVPVAGLPLWNWNDSGFISPFCDPGMEWEWNADNASRNRMTECLK